MPLSESMMVIDTREPRASAGPTERERQMAEAIREAVAIAEQIEDPSPRERSTLRLALALANA